MSELRKNLGEVKAELAERKKLLKRIEHCMDSAEINDWEEEFLESIQEQVDTNSYAETGDVLSDAQLSKLAEIEDTVDEGRSYER